MDSGAQAEPTPSFSLNVLPLWGWRSLQCLWPRSTVEWVHTSLPICCLKCSLFISEMCCLEDKMAVKNPKAWGWRKSWDLDCCGYVHPLPLWWQLLSFQLSNEGEFSQRGWGCFQGQSLFCCRPGPSEDEVQDSNYRWKSWMDLLCKRCPAGFGNFRNSKMIAKVEKRSENTQFLLALCHNCFFPHLGGGT